MGVEVWVLSGGGMSRVGWPGADWALVAPRRTVNSSFQESRHLGSFCALKPAGRPTEGPRPKPTVDMSTLTDRFRLISAIHILYFQ